MSLTGSRPPYPSDPPQYRGQPPTRAAPPAQRAMHARQPDREWAAPPRHTGAARLRQRRLRPLVPWLFLAPALILFLYFKIMPLLQGVKMSFYDVRPYLGDRYVGWGNYVETTTQPQFTRAIWQTVVLAVGTTAGSILLGFLLAILVEGQARQDRPGGGADREHDDGRGGRGLAGHVLPRQGRGAEHHPRLDRGRPRTVPAQPGPGDALGDPGGDLARRAVRHDDLPRRAGHGRPQPLRVGGGRRGQPVEPVLPRDPAVAAPGDHHPRPARGPARAAQLHRGLPAHQRRAGRPHPGDHGADLQARAGAGQAGRRGGRFDDPVRGDGRGDDRGLRLAAAGGDPVRRVDNESLHTVLGLQARNGPLVAILKGILYAAIVMVFAGPLIGLLVGAFSRVPNPTKFTLWPHDFTLQNFAVAGHRGVYRYLVNSFVVVGFGLLLQMIVSVFASYALARKRFRGAALVMLFILATMMLPEEVIAIPLSVVVSDVPVLHVNLIGTYLGMILPLGAWGFSIIVMTEFMREVPITLEEAARIDGAGELRVFWSVVLPMCRPASGCCWPLRSWRCCPRSSRSCCSSASSTAG